MLRGIIACSPTRRSQKKKRMIVRPEPTKRPMMVAEFQGCWTPPHWMARRNIMHAGAKIAKLVRSRFLRVNRKVELVGEVVASFSCWGMRVRIKRTVARPPAGRLM